jgi:hypothetical protein
MSVEPGSFLRVRHADVTCFLIVGRHHKRRPREMGSSALEAVAASISAAAFRAQVIAPSRASALGALLAKLLAERQEPAERLRKTVAGLQVCRSAP